MPIRRSPKGVVTLSTIHENRSAFGVRFPLTLALSSGEPCS